MSGRLADELGILVIGFITDYASKAKMFESINVFKIQLYTSPYLQITNKQSTQ